MSETQIEGREEAPMPPPELPPMTEVPPTVDGMLAFVASEDGALREGAEEFAAKTLNAMDAAAAGLEDSPEAAEARHQTDVLLDANDAAVRELLDAAQREGIAFVDAPVTVRGDAPVSEVIEAAPRTESFPASHLTMHDERETPFGKPAHETRELSPKERAEGQRLVRETVPAASALGEAIEAAYGEAAAAKDREGAAVERELRGEMERIGEIVGPNDNSARNKPLRVRLESGRNAISKPMARENPTFRTKGVEAGGSVGREWLAYQISRALQLGIVPPTVVRDGPEGVGSVQAWQNGTIAADADFEWREEAAAAVELLALFDTLVINADRHGGNFIVEETGAAPGLDAVHAIDQGNILPDVEEGGFRMFRSEPLIGKDSLAGKPLSERARTKLDDFMNAPGVRDALRGAFDAALGDAASNVWNGFMERVDKYSEPGAVFPESVPITGKNKEGKTVIVAYVLEERA